MTTTEVKINMDEWFRSGSEITIATMENDIFKPVDDVTKKYMKNLFRMLQIPDDKLEAFQKNVSENDYATSYTTVDKNEKNLYQRFRQRLSLLFGEKRDEYSFPDKNYDTPDKLKKYQEMFNLVLDDWLDCVSQITTKDEKNKIISFILLSGAKAQGTSKNAFLELLKEHEWNVDNEILVYLFENLPNHLELSFYQNNLIDLAKFIKTNTHYEKKNVYNTFMFFCNQAHRQKYTTTNEATDNSAFYVLNLLVTDQKTVSNFNNSLDTVCYELLQSNIGTTILIEMYNYALNPERENHLLNKFRFNDIIPHFKNQRNRIGPNLNFIEYLFLSTEHENANKNQINENLLRFIFETFPSNENDDQIKKLQLDNISEDSSKSYFSIFFFNTFHIESLFSHFYKKEITKANTKIYIDYSPLLWKLFDLSNLNRIKSALNKFIIEIVNDSINLLKNQEKNTKIAIMEIMENYVIDQLYNNQIDKTTSIKQFFETDDVVKQDEILNTTRIRINSFIGETPSQLYGGSLQKKYTKKQRNKKNQTKKR